MANIVLKDANGDKQIYANIDTIVLKDDKNNDVSFVSSGKYHCFVVDYDGVVLKEQWLNTGDVFTLPDIPVHDRLIFQGWSSSATITNNAVTVEDNDIAVGATYETTSGKSEFDITLTKVTGLDVSIRCMGEIDWGDGTTETTTTSPSTHTYADYGNYTIAVSGSDILNSTYLWGSSDVKAAQLLAVRLASGVTSLGEYIFKYCKNLKTVTIPNSVTSIGRDAFDVCYSLTSVTIPEGVTKLTYGMFGYCYNITSIIIPKSVTVMLCDFMYCHRLNLIALPTNVTDLQIAFTECYNLTSIILPKNITYLCQSLFSSCYSLTSITIPNSVTRIRQSTFYECKGLTSVTIPEGVTQIDSSAFRLCSSLTSIVIPKGVTSIGDSAFYGCSSIIAYDFSAAIAIPTLSTTNAFLYINSICKIIVPDALYDDWIAATNWTTYADYIYKASEVQND